MDSRPDELRGVVGTENEKTKAQVQKEVMDVKQTKTDERRVSKPWLAELNRARVQDLTGQTFNALTVLYRAENRGRRVMWHCRCACGNELDVWAKHLKDGQKSCGCMTKKILSECRTTHGGSRTRLFGVWRHMQERCNNPNHKSYARYGGRGVKVCKEWDHFEAFRDWALQSGYDEKAELMKCTIDRIDNEKGYSPTNCRWVSAKEQANNRSNNRFITLHDETHTVAEWADITGIPHTAIRARLKKGWSEERALTEPARQFKRRAV